MEKYISSMVALLLVLALMATLFSSSDAVFKGAFEENFSKSCPDCGFMTKQSYRFGWFSTKLKLVGGDSVVVVTTFYICSEVEARPLRDEIDFEFLGNRTGQSYLIQTNVYNGCGGREMRHQLCEPTWAPDAKLLSKLIGSVCKCHDLGDDAVELLVIKSILSAVTSVLIRIHGDSLLQVVRTCYDICLESKNVVNPTTAKASLGFITKVLQDIDRVFNAGTLRGKKGELVDGEGERDDDLEVQIRNNLRRDALLVFRALCKFSMKTPPKEAAADPQLMRRKIVALELLKILLENAGAIFRTSDRHLPTILI
ncbi:putative xyloglucan endotransglucosylase/hydrolase protein 8 [Capsicum annuum]|nr:putative xyloglucan endotransglucosylase/hydrolase protein 8 [Capsicum annuum]